MFMDNDNDDMEPGDDGIMFPLMVTISFLGSFSLFIVNVCINIFSGVLLVAKNMAIKAQNDILWYPYIIRRT